MRHTFTNIRCHVVRGLISAIFILTVVSLLQAAPAKSGGKAASTGKPRRQNPKDRKWRPTRKRNRGSSVSKHQTADHENQRGRQ